MKINLVKMDGYSDQEAAKAKVILDRAGEIISSPEFRDAVINFRTPLQGRSFFYRPWQKSYTNEDVYEMIIKAIEDPGNVSEGTMDLYLVLQNGGGGVVIGYGNPGEKEIHTYREAYEDFDDVDYAAHIVHEWTHKLGFGHDVPDMPRRRYSVPYGIQGIITRLF